jgi:hypothetical protein
MGVVVCLLLSWARAVQGQSLESNPWFLRAGVTPAYILSPNPFLSSANQVGPPIRWTPNLTVEIGRQTDGNEEWHALYRMPSYGFGVSFVSFGNGVETGRPLEAYTFFSYPFAHLSDRLDVTTDFGMGLSWGWQKDGKTHAPEDVLGSNVNARINWGFYLRYVSTPRITVYTGIDFTHRSNGGTVQPDRGINVIGPKVAVQYSLAPQASKRCDIDPPPFHPAWEFVVGGAGGVKNAIESRSPLVRADFGALDITAAVQRHFYRFGKITGGTDVMYDGATGAKLDGAGKEWRTDAGQRWALGLYGGYEHVIGRFDALVQIGEIVARGFDTADSRRLYSRYGWRYQINDRVWGTFAVRADGVRNANVLEVGVGYRIRHAGG